MERYSLETGTTNDLWQTDKHSNVHAKQVPGSWFIYPVSHLMFE